MSQSGFKGITKRLKYANRKCFNLNYFFCLFYSRRMKSQSLCYILLLNKRVFRYAVYPCYASKYTEKNTKTQLMPFDSFQQQQKNVKINQKYYQCALNRNNNRHQVSIQKIIFKQSLVRIRCPIHLKHIQL